MPSFLCLDEATQVDVLKQHTFYGLLQNPLAAMVCTQVRDLFHAERREGRMQLPNVIVRPEDRDGAPIVHRLLDRTVTVHTPRDCPKDGVVAILPDNRAGKGSQTLVPRPHVLDGDSHKYIVGIGCKNKVKTGPTIFAGSVTCAGFSFQTLPGDGFRPVFDETLNTFEANAVTVGDLQDEVDAKVTIMDCDASKAENGVAVLCGSRSPSSVEEARGLNMPIIRSKANLHLKNVVMKHNTRCLCVVRPGYLPV